MSSTSRTAEHATRLSRYTNLTNAIHLLRQKHLTLLNPASWSDINDSYYLEAYKNKRKLRSVLALCFTQSNERFHFWRVFGDGASGVCLDFNRTALLDSLDPKVISARQVSYVTLKARMKESVLRIHDLPYLKRYAFKDEDEFRLVNESKKIERNTFEIPIALGWLNSITLSPLMHVSLFKDVSQLLKSIPGCASLRVKHSTILNNEQWQRSGDSAK